MYKISFSYIFNEDIERIFESFVDININSALIFKERLLNLKMTKGERLDEENAEFFFCWKNYYEFKMIVEKVVKEKFHKSLTFRSLIIDKLPIQIILTFKFFWDSIEEKTIFINELGYFDDFFGDLIKNDFNENDKIYLCKNIEQYLSKCLKGLERNYSCLINTSLEEAWYYVSHPKLFYEIITKDLIYVLKDAPISLEAPIDLYVKANDDSQNLIVLTTLNVESMMISPYYAQVTYIALKISSFPSIKLKIQIKKIENNKCFGSIDIKPLDSSLSYEMYCNVFKFWKKRVTDFFNFFEKKGKKDKRDKNSKKS